MSAPHYFAKTPISVEGPHFLPTAVVESSFSDSIAPILLSIFGANNIELAALGRRTLLVWHTDGSRVIGERIKAVVDNILSKKLRSPFQSVQYRPGSPTLLIKPPSLWSALPPPPPRPPPPSTLLFYFAIGGIGPFTSNTVVGRAIAHYLGEQQPLGGHFVSDSTGQSFLYCKVSSQATVDAAINLGSFPFQDASHSFAYAAPPSPRFTFLAPSSYPSFTAAPFGLPTAVGSPLSTSPPFPPMAPPSSTLPLSTRDSTALSLVISSLHSLQLQNFSEPPPSQRLPSWASPPVGHRFPAPPSPQGFPWKHPPESRRCCP
jgi:hypothetical protein